MSHGIRKANLSSEFFIIDQKALLITRRKTRLLNCVCDCSRMAVEWGLAEEIFCQICINFFEPLYLVWNFSTIFTHHDTKIWHCKSIYCSFSSVSRKCG